MNPPHATAVWKGTKILEAVFQTGFHISAQLPLALGQTSEPQPDLVAVAGSFQDYAAHHPTTAALVIEISDSTLGFDLGEKASLYAAGGIADYWIVDINNRRVEVKRNPVPDPAQTYGWSYASVIVFSPGETITPLAVPTAIVAVADLLP